MATTFMVPNCAELSSHIRLETRRRICCMETMAPLPSSIFVDNSSLVQTEAALSSEVTDNSKNNLVVPTPHDVLLGRGKSNIHHPGNARFNELIRSSCDAYCNTSSPVDRKLIISETIDCIDEHGGRFLKRENKGWIVIPRETAHLKVAHAIQYLIRRRMNEYMDKLHQSTEVEGCDTHLLSQAPPLPSLSVFRKLKSIPRPVKQPLAKETRCISLPSRLPVSTYSAFSYDYDSDDFADTMSSIYDGDMVPPTQIFSLDSALTDFVEQQSTSSVHSISEKPEQEDIAENLNSCLVSPYSICSSKSVFEAPLEKRRLRTSATSIGSFDFEELDTSFAEIDW